MMATFTDSAERWLAAIEGGDTAGAWRLSAAPLRELFGNIYDRSQSPAWPVVRMLTDDAPGDAHWPAFEGFAQRRLRGIVDGGQWSGVPMDAFHPNIAVCRGADAALVICVQAEPEGFRVKRAFVKPADVFAPKYWVRGVSTSQSFTCLICGAFFALEGFGSYSPELAPEGIGAVCDACCQQERPDLYSDICEKRERAHD